MKAERLLGKRVRIKVGGVDVNGEVVRVEPKHPKDPDAIVEVRMPARDGRRMAYRRFAQDCEVV